MPLSPFTTAFGAEVLTRQSGADDTVAIHATLKIGNSIIALNVESPEQGILSPLSLGACAGQIHLYLDDVDLSWERALEAGAQVHTPLYDAYWGDRTGILVDGNGHMWSLASDEATIFQTETPSFSSDVRLFGPFDEVSQTGFGVDGEEGDVLRDFQAVRGRYEDHRFVITITEEINQLPDRCQRICTALAKLA